MKYKHDNADLRDISCHLRNKNLAIFPKNLGGLNTILNRLSGVISELKIKLMQKGEFELVVSEQVIEYPLVLRNLPERAKTIFDFGGFESILPLQLSAIGYKVTVLDQRRYPFCHPNLNVLCFDLFGDKLEINERFDVVISVSTIEHLGLGAYSDLAREDADKHGVEILWGFLKEGGRLMASVPVGKPAVQRGYRVYDEKRLNQVFPNPTSIFWFKKEDREGTWREVQPDAVQDMIYDEPYGQMPVEAIAFVICDKHKN